MVFPTVEVDENNKPKQDDSGNYIEVSDADKKQQYENAQKALEELRAGADPEETAEKYGVKDYCTETQGYVGAYADDMNDVMDEIKAGECTDILEQSNGYAIIYVRTDHDQTLMENYVYTVANDYLDSQFEEVKTNWLKTIPVDTENDIQGDAWEKFDLVEMAQDLTDAGLVQ